MDRYIKKYDSSSVLKADVDGRVLQKPYVALINDTSVDYNNLSPSSDINVTPFWVEPNNENSSVTVSLNIRPNFQTIWYSSDASNWTEYTSSAETIAITSRMYFKGLFTGNLINKLVTADNYYKIGGNIYSLVIGDDYLNPDYTFTSDTDYTYYMFRQDSYLKDASQLSANFIYNTTNENTRFLVYAFSGCTNLIAAPAYVRPPKVIGNSTSPFRGCPLLTTAPEYVIEDVSQLSHIGNTFRDNTSLNYIKCLAKGTNLSVNNWATGVAATGTFVKHKDSTWVSGNNGIPTGWTVIDAE